MQALKDKIRHIPDFPKAGILFYDITTLLRDPQGLRDVVSAIADPFAQDRIDLVVGIESRGFIIGGAVADHLGAGFCPVRKPGRLPARTLSETYQLEYGSDALEIHDDAIARGQRVLVVDDVIATGGTAQATARLVRRLGGELCGLSFLIELTALKGRNRLAGERVNTVLQY
jgi:adenine phosphoribosyltransferase